jgi:hypothetical protein
MLIMDPGLSECARVRTRPHRRMLGQWGSPTRGRERATLGSQSPPHQKTRPLCRGRDSLTSVRRRGMKPRTPKRGFYRLPDTPVTATYGASVAPKIYVWLLLPIAITGGVVITFGLILGVSSGSWASPSAKRSASTAGRGGDLRRIQTFTRVALGTITSDITSDRLAHREGLERSAS